jgi:hypothetical protein
MTGSRRYRRTVGLFGLAVLLTAFAPVRADAAWLGYKNDTTTAVVIQAADVVVVNGKPQVRPGKPQVLYPGEVAWNAIAAPGPRIIAVYDPKQLTRPVLQERVDHNAKNDILLSLRLITLPQLPGKPALPPQLKLIPTVLPQRPGGSPAPGTPPGPNPGFTPPATPPPGATPPGNPAPGQKPPPAPPTPPNGQKPPGR